MANAVAAGCLASLGTGLATGLGALCDSCRFQAAVCPYSMNDRELRTNLLAGDFHHPTLFIGGAGGHFRRMRVHRDRGQPLDSSDVPQMTAKARLVDRKIFVEWQQNCRDYAVRNIVAMSCHLGSSFNSADSLHIRKTDALIERPHQRQP